MRIKNALKKILSVSMVICIMLTVAQFPVMAEATTGTTADGLEYSIENAEVTITDYIGSAATLTIPSEISGYPVTAIGNQAFYGCTSLTSITIPDSVTSIGGLAFGYCTSLTSVTIPGSVKIIDFEAFLGCSSIKIMHLQQGVEVLEGNAVFGCNALTTMIIPNSLKKIGAYNFTCDERPTFYYMGTEEEKNRNLTISGGNFEGKEGPLWMYVDSFVSGDVNRDGNVNNKDLGVLRRWLNDWDVEIDELASDVNRDGAVNNKDLGLLRRYLNDWDVELK